MTCFLPTACLFCSRFHGDHSGSELSCDAFDEIPDAIFRGDRRLRFELDGTRSEAFAEVNRLRVAMCLGPFPPASG